MVRDLRSRQGETLLGVEIGIFGTEPERAVGNGAEATPFKALA